MKKIGIIGGLSAQSTYHYEQMINGAIQEKLGGNNSAKMLVSYVNFQEYCEMQEAGEWARSGQLLAEEGKNLKQAGCDVIILATNTMHIVANDIIEALGDTPFLHLADATADEALKQKRSTVAFLGTKYSMEMNFYIGRLKEKNLTVLTPDDVKTREEINRIIFKELTKGQIFESSRAYYIQAIEVLKARGAEAVILGCTEIGMLISEDNSPLPVLDTTEIHAQSAVNFALS